MLGHISLESGFTEVSHLDRAQVILAIAAISGSNCLCKWCNKVHKNQPFFNLPC